jgi:hypothetical protein
MGDTDLMTKTRKHRFVTQCLEAGETRLVVWPTEQEAATKASLKKYQESVEKIAKDPRVVAMVNTTEYEHGVVFTITPE